MPPIAASASGLAKSADASHNDPTMEHNLELLERLVSTAGIPGREQRVRKLIVQETQPADLPPQDQWFQEIRTDPMGSLICVKGPTSRSRGKYKAKPTRVMLAAHMDQIGFMVRHIDDKGFLRVNPLGGFDTRNLFARLVTVCPDPHDARFDLPGVMNPAGRPVHIATEQDKSKIPTIDEFVVDMGLPAEEVKQRVKIGSMVVLKAPFQQVGDTVVSQCLDNRVACWIVIEAIRKLKKHRCEIICVFTVQEEVGLRGALTAAYDVKPDVGIAIDTTLCVDTPGVPAEVSTTTQGKGAALTVMDSASIADLELLETFEHLASEREIPAQRSILGRGGTDAGSIQRAGAGCKTMTLSCPTRYIHTVTEMIHTTDLLACRDLLAAYLEQRV
jgi:endoglucanase